MLLTKLGVPCLVLQGALSMDEVEHDILAWDYGSIIDGSATLSAVSDVGRVPLVFSGMRQYAQVCRTLTAGPK